MPAGIYDRSKSKPRQPHSLETRSKISLAQKGKGLGVRQSPETVQKRVTKLIGQKRTDEQKLRISLASLGKPKSLEARKSMSQCRVGKFRGEESPHWKGGYERKLWHNNQRRIKKLGNGGSHTLTEWESLKAQYEHTCPCCFRQEPEIKLTRDHIVPLVKGGRDDIENIQPLCRSCNAKKHDKNIKY